MRNAALAGMLICGLAGTGAAASQIPAGTRFLVELRDKLEGHKVKKGKKFEAKTLEALQAPDGRSIPAGIRLKGRVSYAENNRMVLRFEEIETPGGKQPLVAMVSQVVGERRVAADPSKEGEIRAESNRGRDAAIGALVVGGIGAAVGATQGGGKGGAIGGAAGAATGAALGAAAGGRELVLDKGARLELTLQRPLTFR